MTEADINRMKASAQSKAEAFTRAVSTDTRWHLEDELMCQVFGFTLYGYIFGIGRLFCFMDVEEIQKLASDQLSGLGVGAKYAEGMMHAAHVEFATEGNTSLHSKLIGIGHSHIASEDIHELVESVFQNTEHIRALMGC